MEMQVLYPVRDDPPDSGEFRQRAVPHRAPHRSHSGIPGTSVARSGSPLRPANVPHSAGPAGRNYPSGFNAQHAVMVVQQGWNSAHDGCSSSGGGASGQFGAVRRRRLSAGSSVGSDSAHRGALRAVDSHGRRRERHGSDSAGPTGRRDRNGSDSASAAAHERFLGGGGGGGGGAGMPANSAGITAANSANNSAAQLMRSESPSASARSTSGMPSTRPSTAGGNYFGIAHSSRPGSANAYAGGMHTPAMLTGRSNASTAHTLSTAVIGPTAANPLAVLGPNERVKSAMGDGPQHGGPLMSSGKARDIGQRPKSGSFVPASSGAAPGPGPQTVPGSYGGFAAIESPRTHRSSSAGGGGGGGGAGPAVGGALPAIDNSGGGTRVGSLPAIEASPAGDRAVENA